MRKRVIYTIILLGTAFYASAQSYSLRTNVVGLATTNLNVEASMTLNKKWSLHLPIQYNPFEFSNNRQFKNLYVAPGVRYWLLQSYIGSFIGLYGTAGTYSVGNLFGIKERYEGDGYGVSVSFGNAYQLSKRWNFEWEVGVGAVWLNQKKHEYHQCGDLLEKEHKWIFAPTRAALNFVYLF